MDTNTRTFRQSLLVYAALFFGMTFFGTVTPTAKVVGAGFPLFLALFLALAARRGPGVINSRVVSYERARDQQRQLVLHLWHW
jgi:hypothetical protein